MIDTIEKELQEVYKQMQLHGREYIQNSPYANHCQKCVDGVTGFRTYPNGKIYIVCSCVRNKLRKELQEKKNGQEG